MSKHVVIPAMTGAYLCMALFAWTVSGCRKSGPPATVQSWNHIDLKPGYEVPGLSGRSESGYAIIQLVADNSLEFQLYVDNLSSSDSLTGAQINFGDPASNGNVVIDLKPVFKSRYTATGIVEKLRPGQIDTLRKRTVYVNIHSKKAGSGLLRGQLDKQISFAADVVLSGSNEVPSVSTTASGRCILRLTNDKVLYSKITVDNLESSDALTAAHIHKGATGVNGDAMFMLGSSAIDFGTVKTSTQLSDAQVQSLLKDALYVNAHSTKHPAGIIRGQIR
jgi:hypothetical protein